MTKVVRGFFLLYGFNVDTTGQNEETQLLPLVVANIFLLFPSVEAIKCLDNSYFSIMPK